MKMVEDEEEIDKRRWRKWKKNHVLIVHYYIQWSCMTQASILFQN